MQKDNLFMPIAIVIAGLIIAGAIYYTNGNSNVVNKDNVENNPATTEEQKPELAPVTDKDHIRGDINAPVKIVEFSDIECPFCKKFHNTLKKVLSDYNGQVAWVYRQFPLEQLHTKAPIESHATECVAELGGEEKFWEYLDKLYETTPSNNQFDLSLLPQIAEEIGIDRAKFEECQTSGRHREKIEAQIQDAVKSGGRGTPHSVIVGPDGSLNVIPGAFSVEQLKPIIDGLLSKK